MDLTHDDRVTSRIQLDGAVSITFVVIDQRRQDIQADDQRSGLGVLRDHTLENHHVAQRHPFDDIRGHMAGVFPDQVEALLTVKQVTLSSRQDMREAITLFRPSIELRQMLWKRLVTNVYRNFTQVPDTQVDDHRRCIDQRVSHSVFLIEGN